MSRSTDAALRRCAALAAMVIVDMPAHAKRVAGYLPPPYFARAGRSLFTLTMLSSPILLILVLAAVASPGAHARTRVVRALTAAFVCVAAGAAIAALDARNDELWNPVLFGTPFLAASLPIGLFQALPRGERSRVSATIIAALFAPLVAGIIYLAGTGLAAHLFLRGWPTSW